ncbi:MAG: hypothetical protein H7Y31_04815 [Chitinophagaceae bacterium]|nr:hypothetical protein [Chitinophagaceae bacterium]
MLTEKEQQFIKHWEATRDSQKKLSNQLLFGIPVGLLFGVPVLLILFSGKFWYTRADTVANSKASPVVLVVAVVIIAAFVAIFYKRHQWDMKEQYYKHLKSKIKDQ